MASTPVEATTEQQAEQEEDTPPADSPEADSKEAEAIAAEEERLKQEKEDKVKAPNQILTISDGGSNAAPVHDGTT